MTDDDRIHSALGGRECTPDARADAETIARASRADRSRYFAELLEEQSADYTAAVTRAALEVAAAQRDRLAAALRALVEAWDSIPEDEPVPDALQDRDDWSWDEARAALAALAEIREGSDD